MQQLTDRPGRLSNKDLKRFLAKVALDDGSRCWEWKAARFPSGYGHFNLRGQTAYPHRVAYEHFVGPIPEGLQIDHLCRVRHCCNPWHLEPVTVLENARRREGVFDSDEALCINGHSRLGDNLYPRRDGKGATCRPCHAASERARRGR